jgi:hypothetical protein
MGQGLYLGKVQAPLMYRPPAEKYDYFDPLIIYRTSDLWHDKGTTERKDPQRLELFLGAPRDFLSPYALCR